MIFEDLSEEEDDDDFEMTIGMIINEGFRRLGRGSQFVHIHMPRI